MVECLFHRLPPCRAMESQLNQCIQKLYQKPLACLECHNGASVKERDCQCRLDVGDAGLIPGLGRFPLEEDTATHSSILAWRIPWTEEPGWLQSIGSQRIGHD